MQTTQKAQIVSKLDININPHWVEVTVSEAIRYTNSGRALIQFWLSDTEPTSNDINFGDILDVSQSLEIEDTEQKIWIQKDHNSTYRISATLSTDGEA